MDQRFPDFTPPTKVAYIGGRPATLHLRKCKLVQEHEDGTTTEYIFDQPAITIGARADTDLVLDDEGDRRRSHCFGRRICEGPVLIAGEYDNLVAGGRRNGVESPIAVEVAQDDVHDGSRC